MMSASILARYIDPGAIALGVAAETAEQVIDDLARRLEASGYVGATYRDAVIAREAAMPTGLPLEGDLAVAVPHTDPVHVLKPGVAIATLAKPVEFRSMEDPDEALSVRVVFALALKDKHEQIEMLQTIAMMLQDPARIRAVIAAGSIQELLAAVTADDDKGE